MDNINYLREKTYKLTTAPGVYIMKDSSGEIIYIGKARNLKNRVSSYFRENPDHTPKTAMMVSSVRDYDFIVTDNEYEALLLECSLIKQHKPKYNILLKDDKGYSYIRISDDEYPRITAEKNTLKAGRYSAPFMSGSVAAETVDEVNKLFMLPTCRRKFPRDLGKSRPCLNYHIKNCMGVCTGKIKQEEYLEIVRQAEEYIKSGSEESVRRMEQEMKDASERLDFERALVLRDRISAIKKSAQRQKIVSETVENADIIGLMSADSHVYISVISYRNGRLTGKKSFEIENDYPVNIILHGFITQFYGDRSDIPEIVAVQEKPFESELTERMLSENCGHRVEIRVPQRGELKELVKMSVNNSAEYAGLKNDRQAREVVALQQLGEVLGLQKPPVYIEAYDISNLGSESICGGMVVFENGRPLKKAYKKFTVKNQFSQDDYASMKEVLTRRLSHIKGSITEKDKDEYFGRVPDLILLDGGRGHVNTIKPVIEEMGLEIPVFGMVKNSRHRTRAICTSDSEIKINHLPEVFNLVTRIQDEVHRYSVSFMKKRHDKKTCFSEILTVRGIGEKRAGKLMKEYRTLENLKKVSPEELARTVGVGEETAKKLWKVIRDM